MHLSADLPAVEDVSIPIDGALVKEVTSLGQTYGSTTILGLFTRRVSSENCEHRIVIDISEGGEPSELVVAVTLCDSGRENRVNRRIHIRIPKGSSSVPARDCVATLLPVD
jgi:hypothetical protein